MGYDELIQLTSFRRRVITAVVASIKTAHRCLPCWSWTFHTPLIELLFVLLILQILRTTGSLYNDEDSCVQIYVYPGIFQTKAFKCWIDFITILLITMMCISKIVRGIFDIVASSFPILIFTLRARQEVLKLPEHPTSLTWRKFACFT